MSPEMKSTQLGGIANLALLAQVEPSFVPGAEAFTYAERLEALFKTLNAIRLASRESTLSTSPFPDALGRWGILHSFRYAVIPPEIGDGDGISKSVDSLAVGRYRLYLSVTFDGGWEPYIRVIYRDLGPLLDTIFTNCIGYPLSRMNTFDTYTRWVRSHEIPAGIFYTESPKSVLDQRYLEEVERIQRQEPDPVRARASIAALSMKPALDIEASLAAFGRADQPTQEETVYNSFRALKALYDLRAYYANDKDGDTLRRFAIVALPEFRTLLKLHGSEPRFAPYAPLMAWLLPDPPQVVIEPPLRGPVDALADGVQKGVLSPYKDVTHGVLFLLAVSKADKAREYLQARLSSLSVEGQQPPAAGELYCNVAFTRRGLEAIQAPGECLDWLPQEFVEGMESRAGMLGDVRSNHPEHWHRPLYQGAEVDLGSVHVVLQFRLADQPTSDGSLHARFEPLRAELATHEGFRLLSTEPMRSSPTPDGHSVEHFGFKDGFSQPSVASGTPDGTKWDNSVQQGELLLGCPNDRHDGPYPPAVNSYLDSGSFLVLRKIRQDVDAWRQTLRRVASDLDPHLEQLSQFEQDAALARVAAKMVGRDSNGNPAVDPALGPSNDFNYEQDPLGSQCPFQSHIRRANPRLGKTPRLVRRGMSYGPTVDSALPGERGLYFMAYCASIAEQFEIVQRWIAGGNSSGVLATHSDPMLGVPQAGVPRSFHWLDAEGRVAKVDLGEQPLTQLQWGLYLFAPSKKGLQQLTSRAKSYPPTPPRPVEWRGEAYDPGSKVFEERKAMLQDRDKRDLIWRRVNEAGGKVQTAYGLLVANPDKALAILKDHGRSYSVWGYGRRFKETIGIGFLGLDPEEGHTRLAEESRIKARVAEITEEKAFEATCEVTRALLARLAPAGHESPVDILDLNERVLAALCALWFGLPDESFMLTGTSAKGFNNQATDPPCCPRDFVHVARHIFGPHPTEDERQRGKDRGKAIHRGVSDYLADQKARGQPLVELSAFIATALSAESSDVVAQTIAGVILGFAPSVHGNYTNVMRAWVEHSASDTPSLWDLQTRMLGLEAQKRAGFAAAKEVLRPELIKQMSRAIVPPAIWRERPCPAGLSEAAKAEIGSSPKTEPPKIVVGLQGVMQNDPSEIMMFGGALRGGPSELRKFETDHACPGRGMAIGVLLGVISTLLLAGTLRTTPSYTLIKIVR